MNKLEEAINQSNVIIENAINEFEKLANEQNILYIRSGTKLNFPEGNISDIEKLLLQSFQKVLPTNLKHIAPMLVKTII